MARFGPQPPRPATTIPVAFGVWHPNRNGRYSRLVAGDQICNFVARTETGYLAGTLGKYSTYFGVTFDGLDDLIIVPESRGSREHIFNLAYAGYLRRLADLRNR